MMQLLMDNMAQVLGITLIHSLWQGLVIYVALRMLFLWFPDFSSDKKYAVSLLALFSLAAVFVYTFVSQVQMYDWQPAVAADYIPVSAPTDISEQIGYTSNANLVELNLHPSNISFTGIFKASLPYITSLYLVGLIINLCMIGIAWNKIQIIKKSLWDAKYLQAKVDGFSKQFKINQKVRVSFSRLIDVPCVVGYLKPVILLPVTLTTLLSAEEVEAILLHELSHIKNNDYVLNLVQQMVSVLLFFNPFAQLISREVTAERENRCDDWVVTKTGKPLIYASALVKLEETRHEEVRLALAASGKKHFLRTRIERILNTHQSDRSIRHWLLLVLFICSAAFWFSFKTTSKTAFNLSGNISGGIDSVSLYYANEQGQQVTQKSTVSNGSFRFNGHINGPRLVFLNAYKAKHKPVNTSFFIDPGTVTATGDFNNLGHVIIKGSAAQEDYKNYQKQSASLNQGAAVLIAQWNQLKKEERKTIAQHKSESEIDLIEQKMEKNTDQLIPYRNKIEDYARQFINTHPSSYVSALQLVVYAKMWPVNTVKSLFNNFDAEVKNSSYGKAISRIILEMEGSPAGTTAADFTAQEHNGKQISLSDLKGKVVMLDFWTSAQPQLANTPYLINIYKKYQHKEFDIISVADDDKDIESWKRYIKKTGVDRLWHQVLRGVKYQEGHSDITNAIDNKFKVSVLPTRILIGPDGKIIGRYIGTEGNAELDKKLTALFD
jgi:beta-lactamase regulating signal transducer with metallopeptidase domain/cytochrome oxidase Cu insertion factor (SCO1/SenC/PrrC family)